MSSKFIITSKESGRTLAAVLKARQGLTWTQARRLIELRRVRLGGQGCGDSVRRVKAGQRVEIAEERGARSAKRKKEQPPQPRPARYPLAGRHKAGRGEKGATSVPEAVLRYVDEDIVVVDKPPGMTTHRSATEAAEFGKRGRRYLPSTLANRLPSLLPSGGEIRAVHRIDRDTSGLVVFARTPEAEAELGRQFRLHTVGRRYLAIARGRPKEATIQSWLVRDRGDGRRGSVSSAPLMEGGSVTAQRAVTHFRVLEEVGPCCLVECRLETGRTHQVRIHLGETGAPLAGERVYDRPLNGPPAADPSGSPRIALHAANLGFTHPRTGRWMEWESPLPEDLQTVVRRLRENS